MPDKEAPMHNPVDIAPHPQYRSNKNFSLMGGVSVQLEPHSLEIVDDGSRSVW